MNGEAQINIHATHTLMCFWVDDECVQVSRCQKSRKEAPKPVHRTGRGKSVVCFGG